MKQPSSGPTKTPAGSKTSDLAWKSKDYGLGPEPKWGTPEWEDWIETRAILAGLREARDENTKE